MSAPQFPPAVLASLARWDTARLAYEEACARCPFWLETCEVLETRAAQDAAMLALRTALNEFHASRDAAMHAAESEALDEALAASPHRFKVREIL